MRSLAQLLALAAVLGTGTGAPAAAQDASEFDSRRLPGWSFTPGVSFGGVFDTNVALAAPPADADATQSDQLLVFQPFGQLEYLSRRTEFGAGYRGYGRRYIDVRELDGFDSQASLSLRRLVTRRLTFFLTDAFTAAPTTDEVQLNGVPFTRTGVRTNTASTGIEARLTKFTSLSARYDLTWVDFERSDTLLTGGWVNAWQTELTRQISERVAVGAQYALRLADLNEGTRELTFHDAGGTIEIALAAHTTLTAGAGASYMNDQLLDETRTGPYYRAALTRRVERSTIGISYDRMFVPSFGFGGSSDSQELSGFVRMPVSRNRAYVQASAGWRRTDPFLLDEVELDTVLVRTTVGYSVLRWLRVEGFHAYTRQDSKVTGGEIDRHRAGGQLVIAQPMRIR